MSFRYIDISSASSSSLVHSRIFLAQYILHKVLQTQWQVKKTVILNKNSEVVVELTVHLTELHTVYSRKIMHQSPKGSKFRPRIYMYSIFITEILLAIWYKWPGTQNKDRNKMVSHPNLTHRSWSEQTKKVNFDTKLQNITTLLYSSGSHLLHKNHASCHSKPSPIEKHSRARTTYCMVHSKRYTISHSFNKKSTLHKGNINNKNNNRKDIIVTLTSMIATD